MRGLQHWLLLIMNLKLDYLRCYFCDWNAENIFHAVSEQVWYIWEEGPKSKSEINIAFDCHDKRFAFFGPLIQLYIV